MSYVDAKIVDVILDPYTLNRWFDEDDDIFSITDSFSFLYSKAATDAVGITDLPAIGFSKPLTEALSLGDSAAVLLILQREFADSVSISESFSKLLEIGLPLAHGVSIDDLLTTVLN
ncbi:uncharacterized protein METZ01_LOCUS197439, partial [marine metagenome]